MSETKVGDVIQMDRSKERFAFCLATVDEVKSWGVHAFVRIPDPHGPRNAYVRVTHGNYSVIGRAEWVPQS